MVMIQGRVRRVEGDRALLAEGEAEAWLEGLASTPGNTRSILCLSTELCRRCRLGGGGAVRAVCGAAGGGGAGRAQNSGQQTHKPHRRPSPAGGDCATLQCSLQCSVQAVWPLEVAELQALQAGRVVPPPVRQ